MDFESRSNNIHLMSFLQRTILIILLIFIIEDVSNRDLENEFVDINININSENIKSDISELLMGMNMSYHRDIDERWADGRIAARLSEINTSILRFPGGEETNTYHWKECPGAPAWKDSWETDSTSNYYFDTTLCTTSIYMDTEEFLQWCEVIGAEPVMGINYVSGFRYDRLDDSIEEAISWVQYCKDKGYNVKYWCIGNETYGGFISAEDYAEVINRFSQALKQVDPEIKIMVNGPGKLTLPHVWDRWETMINIAGDNFEIGEVHWQWARLSSSWNKYLSQNPLINEFHTYEGLSYKREADIWYNRISELGYDIKLAVTEWNAGPPNEDLWDENSLSAFQCALVQSEMLMQFIEGGIYMACLYPSTFNIVGARNPNRTLIDPETLEPRPGFYVFKMFSNAMGLKLIECNSSSIKVPCVAALSESEEQLYIYLINKDSVCQNVSIAMLGELIEYSQAISLVAVGGVYSNEGEIRGQDIICSEGICYITLSPYSITMITVLSTSKRPEISSYYSVQPNPFMDKIEIRYQLSERTNVQLNIYDAKGRKVYTLVDSIKDPGYYTKIWDGIDSKGNIIPSGVYFVKMKTESLQAIQKLVKIH